MPGNVMMFCRADDRAAIVGNLARHLDRRRVSWWPASRCSTTADALTLADYDAACTAAGLALVNRFATWDKAPYEGGDYAVSVHSRVGN